MKPSILSIARIEFQFVAAIAMLALCGCAYDHTEKIAASTLTTVKGALDKQVYSAAMNAKFPAGSRVELLNEYVQSNKGNCTVRSPYQVRCEIPIRAKFCAAYLIGIDATTNDHAIQSLAIQIGDLTC